MGPERVPLVWGKKYQGSQQNIQAESRGQSYFWELSRFYEWEELGSFLSWPHASIHVKKQSVSDKIWLKRNASVYGRARSPLTKLDGVYSDTFIFFSFGFLETPKKF